jgi:chromate transport protein ChrA
MVSLRFQHRVENTNTCQRQEVRCSVQVYEARTKDDKEVVHNQITSAVPEATRPITPTGLLGSKKDGEFILWLALFGSAIASLVFFALGCVHSPHLQGTTNDADFWFLIQAAIMQLLGLVVSALLERKVGDLPKWRWALPTMIAAACSVTAIPLYLVVPSEWSTFLSLVASATQSFMVLQHFLSSSQSNGVLHL